MSAAIHTRYSGGAIVARTKDGKGIMRLRVPYDHSLHHSKRHPAAAKALAEKLGWSGLWIVGHNEDNSICAVKIYDPSEVPNSALGFEGEDYFIAGESA